MLDNDRRALWRATATHAITRPMGTWQRCEAFDAFSDAFTPDDFLALDAALTEAQHDNQRYAHTVDAAEQRAALLTLTVKEMQAIFREQVERADKAERERDEARAALGSIVDAGVRVSAMHASTMLTRTDWEAALDEAVSGLRRALHGMNVVARAVAIDAEIDADFRAENAALRADVLGLNAALTAAEQRAARAETVEARLALQLVDARGAITAALDDWRREEQCTEHLARLVRFFKDDRDRALMGWDRVDANHARIVAENTALRAEVQGWADIAPDAKDALTRMCAVVDACREETLAEMVLEATATPSVGDKIALAIAHQLRRAAVAAYRTREVGK